MVKKNVLRQAIVVTIFLLIIFAAVPMFAMAQPGNGEGLDPDIQFYVAKRNQGAIEQFAKLTANGDQENGDLIKKLIALPQSVWIESGSPQEVQQAVKGTVQRASGKGTVPVLVAYYLPFRDCSQY
jgi:endoglucanase